MHPLADKICDFYASEKKERTIWPFKEQVNRITIEWLKSKVCDLVAAKGSLSFGTKAEAIDKVLCLQPQPYEWCSHIPRGDLYPWITWNFCVECGEKKPKS